MIVRDANEQDFDRILELNKASEEKTSPMSFDRLRLIDSLSSYHKVAVDAGKVDGFAVAMSDTATYVNDNFAWFKERYTSFLYLDRIVIDLKLVARGTGSALYHDLIRHAEGLGLDFIVCEYNLKPLNIASKGLHEKFAFTEVGQRTTSGQSKLVSMQAKAIS